MKGSKWPEDFKRKITNKNVIIVFPSKATEAQINCEKIEQFDTVIRIGNGFKTEGIEDKIGKRTDILFHSLRANVKYQGIQGIYPKELKKRGINFVIYKNNGRCRVRYSNLRWKFAAQKIKVIESIANPLKGTRDKLKEKNSKRQAPPAGSLLQGMVAITTVLFFNPKKLFIYGKDFYDSGHHTNYKTKHIDPRQVKKSADRSHNLKRMKAILGTIIEAHDCIEIDTVTSKSLLKHNFSKEAREIIKNKTNYNF